MNTPTRFRVTLAQLLLLTTAIAMGCAALAQASHPWTLSIVQAAMLVAIFAGIVQLHRDSGRRTFSAAFLLTAALHMLFLIGWFLSGPNRDPPLGVLLAYSWCLAHDMPYEGNLLSNHFDDPGGKFVLVGMWVTTFWAGVAIGWLACTVRGDEPES